MRRQARHRRTGSLVLIAVLPVSVLLGPGGIVAASPSDAGEGGNGRLSAAADASLVIAPLPGVLLRQVVPPVRRGPVAERPLAAGDVTEPAPRGAGGGPGEHGSAGAAGGDAGSDAPRGDAVDAGSTGPADEAADTPPAGGDGGGEGRNEVADAAVGALGRVTQQPRAPEVWEDRRGHLEGLAAVHGHDWGTVLTDEDLLVLARRLNVDVGSRVDLDDVERLLDAHRQTASSVIRALGHDHRSRVTNEDLLRTAEILRIDVGAFADPRDVERVKREGERYLDFRRHGLRPNLNARTPVFASSNRVVIHSPSTDVVLVGFHQAAMRGVSQLQHHRTERMMTLPSRGRGTGSRTAADISVRPGTEVLAPVTGRVVSVQSYALYGRYPDVRMQIVPDDNPAMVLTVLHVTGPRVRVGQQVEAGRTVIAREATQFPFTSQIDRFAGRLPHVHIEMRRR